MDQRKSIKVVPTVKTALREVKTAEKLASESETIAYLIEVYRRKSDELTKKQLREIQEAIEQMHKQQTLSV